MDLKITNIELLAESKPEDENAYIAIEEMSELVKEITKKLRNIERPADWLVEEIADTLISITILLYQYGITSKDLDDMISRKMDRNLRRIDHESE